MSWWLPRRGPRAAVVLGCACLCLFLVVLPHWPPESPHAPRRPAATPGCLSLPRVQETVARRRNPSSLWLRLRGKRSHPPLRHPELVVRFGRPYVGYGGRSGRALLAPFGFRPWDPQTDADDHWHLLWTFTPKYEGNGTDGLARRLQPWQKHNHCLPLEGPHGIAGPKSTQWRLHQAFVRRFPGEPLVMPQTFVLPGEYPGCVAAMEAQPGALWIVKPSKGARGLGVRVVSHPREVPARPGEEYLVQRYVADPLLIDGKKFHLRFYLLITSLTPLRVRVHDQGLVLFAHKPFHVAPASLRDTEVHLTNAAIKGRGATWTLEQLWARLAATHGPQTVERLQGKIESALLQIVQGGQGPGFVPRDAGTCFDMYGVDVLVTSAFQPWVLEVNNAPELHSTTAAGHEVNERVHQAVVHDLVRGFAMFRAATTQSLLALADALAELPTALQRELCVVSAACLDRLWLAFDEERHSGGFQRIYPRAATLALRSRSTVLSDEPTRGAGRCPAGLVTALVTARKKRAA